MPGKMTNNKKKTDRKTSLHVGGSSELTVIAPIRKELVAVSHMTLSHATRLKMLFATLLGSAKASAEKSEGQHKFTNPLEQLDVLHFVRYGLVENDTKLLLAVAFDGGWETYIRDKIVGMAGPLLDVIFCHCEGYAGHSTDLGYPPFAKWVSENLVEMQYFFSGFPDRTVGDIRYLEDFERLHRENHALPTTQRERLLAKHHNEPRPYYPRLNQTERDDRHKNLLKFVSALYDLDGVFSPNPEERVYLQRSAALLVLELGGPRLGFAEISPELKVEYGEELEWLRGGFADLPNALPSEKDVPRVGPEYKKDAQGGILTPYKQATHGALLFLRIRHPDVAREFLASFDPTPDAAAEASAESRNLAFTYEGLKRLGLPKHDLALLPTEFVDGMAERAGLLGDVGVNHPSNWTPLPANWPLQDEETGETVPLSSVDIVVQLRTKAADTEGAHHRLSRAHPLYDKIDEISRHEGVDLMSVQPTYKLLQNGKDHEHFGFRDGISQPRFRDADRTHPDWTPLGDFLLGHPNRMNDQLEIPKGFENGSFLVVRKMKQNLAALKKFEEDNAGRLAMGGGSSRRGIAEILMGRQRDGTPLGTPVGENWEGKDNRFDYESSPYNDAIPRLTHIRRTNPRAKKTSANPRVEETKTRIMRRGMSYGSAEHDPDDVGLVFMAYNASLAQQFEVIQRWVSGGNPTGTYSGVRDPFLGVPRPGESRWIRVVHGNDVVSVKLPDEPFATLKWGLYLFAPSLPGLRHLSETAAARPEDQPSEHSVLKQMKEADKGESKEVARDRWRVMLEDPRTEEEAEHLWSDVRRVGGVSHTKHYGVLVGSLDCVREVLTKEQHFSVREYWDRMNKSLGALYLGMDHKPRSSKKSDPLDRRYTKAVGAGRYDTEQAFLNPWLRRFGLKNAFKASTDVMNGLLSGHEPVPTLDLAFRLVAGLSKEWFGIPDESHVHTTRARTLGQDPAGAPNCPGDFNAVARYVFWPYPTMAVETYGRLRGEGLQEAVKDFLDDHRLLKKASRHRFVAELLKAHPDDDELVVQLLLGAIHGFVAATAGNFENVASEWAESGELWRLQRELALQPSRTPEDRLKRAEGVLKLPLIRAMQASPVPDLLHRTAITTTELAGVKIKAGDRIVVSTRSAATEQPGNPEILFGGKYSQSGSKIKHACPAQDMAIGVLLGAFSALLEGYTIEEMRPRLWKVEPR